jgi:5-methylthioribose kinase
LIQRVHRRSSYPDNPPGSDNPGDCLQDTAHETVLEGGVSSDIRIVQSPQGSYVVKRALKKLKVKADWFADPARSSTEVCGLRAMAQLLGQAHVPKVLWADEAAHQFAMELIDARFKNWKQQLLQGNVDPATARTAGRLLGQLHTRSSTASCLAQQFANTQPFIELRIRPFFERIAQKNPSLAPDIVRIIKNILATRNALVHGDYSPKNLLVDGGDVVILDCEVAHWGDARFDVAFCVAHLLLKSFRRGAPKPLLRYAVVAFLSEYRRAGLAVLDEHFVRQLGCLLLARLEGDSPVAYLDDLEARAVRQLAIELILRPPAFTEFDIGAIMGLTE